MRFLPIASDKMRVAAKRETTKRIMELSEMMRSTAKIFVCAREFMVRNTRGQTMTEYALILAAIAVVVWAAYRTMGNNIGTLASGIDSSLTNA